MKVRLRRSAHITGAAIIAAMLAGCGAQAASAPPAAPSATAAPTPGFTCVVVPNTAATNYTGMPQIMTAQVTVTMPGDGQTTDFGGFEVVYYDASGSELGSATLDGVGYVTPGQSLQTAMDATQEAPSGASTCQLVTWHRDSNPGG